MAKYKVELMESKMTVEGESVEEAIDMAKDIILDLPDSAFTVIEVEDVTETVVDDEIEVEIDDYDDMEEVETEDDI